MRVVLTCNFSPWSSYRGGGQVSTHQLGTALAALGHDVHVVFTKAPGEAVPAPRDLPYALSWAPFVGLRSRRQGPLRPLNGIGVATQVARLVRGRSDAVVHSQGEEGVWVPRTVPGTPWLLTPRYPSYPAPMLQDAPDRTALAKLWLLDSKYMLLRQYAHAADFVCPTSQAAAQMVATALRVKRTAIRVVPNGVEPAFLLAPERALLPDAPIVFFGRVEEAKGVDVLLDAYARLDAPPPLRVIGDGHYLEQAKVRTASMSPGTNVRFEPWVSQSELARVLAGARCAVLPSREESFGNAMVEAMAAGAPLVTTDVGALPEVTRGGALAWLVPAGDSAALQTQLEHVLHARQAAEARASEARSWIATSYSWEASARSFVMLYEEALAQHGR